MRNLWLFLRRYNAVFWFILFFGFSVFLVIKNNSFQRASFFNSANYTVGSLYQKVNGWRNYLSLSKTNKDLSEENALLRQQLQNYRVTDTLKSDSLPKLDSLDSGRYQFITAEVTNNSVHQKSNYITINKGSDAGVEKGMGVMSPTGVVGIVLNVSKHFATIQSLLHPDTKISVTLEDPTVFGSLVWGNNMDYRYGMVKDIPNHIKVKKGEKVYTNTYSQHFPKGILVGTIVETGISSGDSFLDLKIKLSTDFSNLNYVYIVKDSMTPEIKALEETNKEND